ncbi:MAG: ATP-binding protein [Candidatus Levybacteria bacterium]|nr:ATP-binding protein [Candidatus Levybacteria bacterium]
MIPRLMEEAILKSLELKKIILILGARQVGKTTIIKKIQQKLAESGKKTLYLNCDSDEERNAVNTTSKVLLEKLLKNTQALLIDEAQRLENPGLTLKILYDNFPNNTIIVTGSSSFELKNKMSDALTGRYIDFTLFPLSFSEVLSYSANSQNKILQKEYAQSLLPQTLLYGFYPEIYLENHPENKELMLRKIVESYLFADILSFQRIRNSQAVKDLAKALAYQVGSEVNENELATRLKIDRKTVVSYLDILEKAFVIVRVHPFSKNPRREIGRNYKIYFSDLGIRNALIGDFNPVAIRRDVGFLWENFLFIERMKKFANQAKPVSLYFWRSYGGAEVDYIEALPSQKLAAYEFKYSDGRISRGAVSFTKQYSTKVKLITTENFFDFI